MATATKAKEAKAAQNEPVTFIARGTNLLLTLEAPYVVKNHVGQVVKTFSARYLQFKGGSFLLTDDLITKWNVNREKEDRDEAHQRPMLDFETVVDEIKSNPSFDKKQGFWQVEHQPGALEPSIEVLSEKIVTASATQNVAEIKRLIETERETHGRPKVLDMANAALAAIAASDDEPAEESADEDV